MSAQFLGLGFPAPPEPPPAPLARPQQPTARHQQPPRQEQQQAWQQQQQQQQHLLKNIFLGGAWLCGVAKNI